MQRFAPRIALLLLSMLQLSLPVVAQNTTHAPQESRVAKASADQVWAKLAAGNNRFISGKTRAHDYVSQRHASPKVSNRESLC